MGLIFATYTAIEFMPTYQVVGAALAWSIGLFVAMLAYIIIYLYHHQKFYLKHTLYFKVAVSLVVFTVSFMVVQRLSYIEDLSFIQGFSTTLSLALSMTVLINFILSKLMYGIKPHNS